jgi:ribose transport system substrate-binding protein
LTKAKISRLYLIPILSKAMDILELLETEKKPLTLEDIFQKVHISKTSVYRILKTFVHRGSLNRRTDVIAPPHVPRKSASASPARA